MDQVTQRWHPDYREMVSRNLGLLTPGQQERLRTARCAVFGMGGIGGVAFEVLVRSGVGHFSIVDKDNFEPSNLNRQIHATRQTLGRLKVEVARERALTINPGVEVATWNRVNEDNVADILKAADVAVQAIDQLRASLILSRKARQMGVPFVEGWAIPFANVRTFTRETPTLEQAYGLPTAGRPIAEITDDEIAEIQTDLLLGLRRIDGVAGFYDEAALKQVAEGRITSFAPMVWLTAVLMALEAVKVLLGWGTLARAPAFALYDPFEHRVPRMLPSAP